MQAIIQQFRQEHNKKALKPFKCSPVQDSSSKRIYDVNYAKRWALIRSLYEVYSVDDRKLLQWLLKQELRAYCVWASLPFSVYVCAFMLYDVMKAKDSLWLYQAKLAGDSDLQCCVDTEILFGKKPKATLAFLKHKKRKGHKTAKQALKAIKFYRSHKEAVYKTPDDFVAFFKNQRVLSLFADIEDYFLNENEAITNG